MKWIIDGKRYDSEKANHIARHSNNYDRSDFKYLEEDLYRTNKGNWFLVGKGGAMSKYAEPCAGGGHSGSTNNCTPLSDQEAFEWLEAHEETVALEKFFPEKIEDA